ncbi:MAG: DsrE family protein [Sulfolobaceae archaeon]|nr:DsrE family protein [Sulfolobaceae archaeon]
MAKVVFLITSGDEKFNLGLIMAYNSFKNKRYDDVKIIFFGPSQKKLTQLEGDQKKMVQELLENKVIDSACIGVANQMNIKPDLEKLGISLMPAGERVSYYVNQGYEVITF